MKQIAATLGLDDCRIAAVTGPAAHAEQYQQWIDAGEHGEMDWMAKNPNRRKDPREVLPSIRSVITVALNYYQAEPPPLSPTLPSPAGSGPVPSAPGLSPLRGRIARYAWGDDYHEVLDGKLRDLCEWLEDQGGAQRLYADTGPVLERDWASASGLGWNGKSTIQIHPRMGCYFFLGEILTTLAIAPDKPLADHCGKCMRCINACPTGAITSPRHVDARRCVSYLTIESKSAIPLEFRRAIGDRLYGCDDCLAACPWNRFAQDSREAAFATRPFVAQWSPRDFLTLTDDTFRNLFRHSPIRRIKRPAFLRNVCTVLGNTGIAADLPALRMAAADPHPLIAEHAVWAVTEITAREADAGKAENPQHPQMPPHAGTGRF
ncbi:MAG: Epoxyqueuosine reductase [Verrucomicrobiales bacterium]|nr:Epoxyqueuosine reductase [Verrucomicrobiales bacterium]